MKEVGYDRQQVYDYAKRWAFTRNPEYYNFDSVGGDCTSFASQCIYKGSGTMNYTKEKGWYYIDGNHKSPSWSGVQFLYDFLINNKTVGPYGKELKQENLEELQIGDIAQLSFDGNVYGHTLIIVNIENKFSLNGIKIASHTFDSFNKAISEYVFKKIRFVHIQNVRRY
ncbi:MAG: amidase domain-containing protein [Clostridia bacterium]|nr:amidase domain-containing protein [Clostridia bacterium]